MYLMFVGNKNEPGCIIAFANSEEDARHYLKTGEPELYSEEEGFHCFPPVEGLTLAAVTELED